MQPIRVLFLAANPFDKSRLRLDEEYRDVELEISHGEYGDDLDPRLHPAVRSKDLYDALLRRRPHVVHFCGHSDTEGIYLDESDSPVPGSALRDLFAAFKDSIRLVVLNACATHEQAEAIRQVIPCAVGMASPISDEAATKFALGFYRALAEGDSVAGAHRLGVNRIQIDNLPGDDAPRLFAGDGVDPETLHLVGEHARGEVSIPEKVHVDRTEELALFTKMLARDVEVRMLFVEGQKGMGKTMLVDQFWKKAEAHARARVTFKRTVAPEDVLQMLADKLGPQLDVDPAALLEDFVVATAPATVGVGAIQPSSPARRMPGLSRDNTRQTVSLRMQTECFLKTVADCPAPGSQPPSCSSTISTCGKASSRNGCRTTCSVPSPLTRASATGSWSWSPARPPRRSTSRPAAWSGRWGG